MWGAARLADLKRLPAIFYGTASGHEPVREIRSDISHGRTARVLFCITDGHMVLLHGFVKKAQKTPKPDLDLAMKRKRSLHHE
jgi:phage-related protein